MSARGKIYSTLLGGVAAAALLSGAARAEDVALNIAPQPLGDALNEFAVQSKHSVVFAPGLVAEKSSHGVTSAATAELALAELLDGSGLSYRRNGDTFLIVSASDPQSGSAAGDGADGTVQALVVTAQKREENIQDVPIAMSAFTQEDLTKSQVAGGADLMTQVPNMTFTKTNFTSYSIQIRGIGTQAISATTDPAVAVAFNNTPFIANHFFEQEFYDLERVEVLRGPQGTLYGRNATAGVVNIISAKPKNRFEAKLSGDLANYSSSRLEGMVNIPLVEDKLALRVAGAWTKRDGFVKNILTGQQTDGRDLWSTRITLGLTPTDRFSANLIYERFEENDDRLRSGKQLCHKDFGPAEINGVPVEQTADPIFGGPAVAAYWSQGCKPASLYSPDSFDTPNGYALAYYGAAAGIGAPVYQTLDPYRSSAQSRNLREIETHITPEYEAAADIVELQMSFDLTDGLALASETGFSHDHIFSFEDFNRFDTTPGVFQPGGSDGDRLDVVSADGVFCDPQLGCTNRLAAGDLAVGNSKQFSQEFRLASNFEGPINFNIGVNFLRYDTEIKYYVFINTLTALEAFGPEVYVGPWDPRTTDHLGCFNNRFSRTGLMWSDANAAYGLGGCHYIDLNDIHSLNDQGRNYFLSKNPYRLISYSGFGETYYQITPSLKLTGGFRWTVDRKTAPQIPSWLLAAGSYGTPTRKVVNLEWQEPSGRLAIDWKPQLTFTDDTLVYASYVRGYKAGGANPPPAISVFPPVYMPQRLIDATVAESQNFPTTFKPEFVNAYEIGTKNTLLDGGLILNLNGFYYDYTDYQISEIVDRSALNLNFDAKIWGAELEATWRPVENLQLAFKGGYENTRLADGSRAVDLMDRTAGDPNYLMRRPFPTFSSNCIVPVELAFTIGCEAYKLGSDPTTGLPIDPITLLPYVANPTVKLNSYSQVVPLDMPGYAGFDRRTVPSNGEGIAKDLSGNMLPNAPKFTATITADYTLPLPSEWLMTLHTDLYYQSEAWTRIFNTPGYDKLKAFNNVNLAAIFTNEDRGWTVMAYVKNVLDKDNVTGAFLNSDDTGLTTNVFLTEPRLYGLRVTKNWSGDGPFGSLFMHNQGEPYPFRLELGGIHGPFRADHDIFRPVTTALFTPDFPFPFKSQRDIDWGTDGGAKITYSPNVGGWDVSLAMRYGHAAGNPEAHGFKGVTGLSCQTTPYYAWCLDTATGRETVAFTGSAPFDYGGGNPVRNFYSSSTRNDETHAIADLAVGREFTLPGWGSDGIASNIEAGLRYAKLKSNTTGMLGGRTGLYYPAEVSGETQTHNHFFFADLSAHREFEGAGPAVLWNAALPLLSLSAAGRVDLEISLGGSLLFGKQSAKVHYGGEDYNLSGPYWSTTQNDLTPPVITSVQVNRSRNVTVPSADASIGLSYTLGGLKVSGGYRRERYFNAIDGGLEKAKKYDRDIDGVFTKISLGFGG